ncbi:MAG: 3-hydroxybutyryl-CoA dehydrogenase [Elusimicrobia bacterium]|nr:3-hydroxybutyryl-CoA dehydrogenase [Elusimicrobiota bacterium]
MKTLGVVGAGTMGRDIAQLALQSGLSVALNDADPAALERARGAVEAGLAKGVGRGKLSEEEARAALARLSFARGLHDLAACDAVVEAVFEDLALKRDLFGRLERLVPAPVPLATNTSSFLVAQVAAGAEDKGRVVGLHFFNPPVAMRLVEVVRHPGTGDAAWAGAWDLALALGRTPVAVKDGPGFLVNRVMRSYYLVAQRLAAEGAGTLSELDGAMTAQGLPMGPFTLMDFIGLEVNLAITRSIYEGMGRPARLEPHWLQERLVGMGFKGVKSAAGFYLYLGGKKDQENPAAVSLLPRHPKPLPPDTVFRRVMEAVRAEAELMAEEGVAASKDIDTAVELAMNFPKGPFAWGRRGAQA